MDIDAYRAWWYRRFCPVRRCAACGSTRNVQLHHVRYRAVQQVVDFVPLCRTHHVGHVHRIHRARFGENGDRSEVAPSEWWWFGELHPQLAVVTWQVVRRVRRRSWRRYVGLVPRFVWEGQR